MDGIKSSLGFNHQRLINEITDLTISHRYRVVTEYPMLKVEDAFVFPALSIPIEKKDAFACPDEHIASLAEATPEITRIITIGWRATELKFLNMLGSRLTGLRHRPALLIVSGSRKGAEETLQNLLSHTQASGFAFVEGGFTGPSPKTLTYWIISFVHDSSIFSPTQQAITPQASENATMYRPPGACEPSRSPHRWQI